MNNEDKKLCERLNRTPTASEFLSLSNLYALLDSERKEAAQAIERLSAEKELAWSAQRLCAEELAALRAELAEQESKHE